VGANKQGHILVGCLQGLSLELCIPGQGYRRMHPHSQHWPYMRQSTLQNAALRLVMASCDIVHIVFSTADETYGQTCYCGRRRRQSLLSFSGVIAVPENLLWTRPVNRATCLGSDLARGSGWHTPIALREGITWQIWMLCTDDLWPWHHCFVMIL
jgi:hypothetical protein